MRVLLSTYGSSGNVETVAGFTLQFRTRNEEVWVCAPRDFAEMLSSVGVPLVPIGVWR